jgi:hypothetical protein
MNVHFRISRRARFGSQPIDSGGMEKVGQTLLNNVDQRIGLGLTTRDVPANRLSPAYARKKSRLGKRPIRDWNMTGFLRNSLQVLQSIANRVVVGTNNVFATQRLNVLNRQDQMFGVSPTDRLAMLEAVRRVLRVGRPEQVGK